MEKFSYGLYIRYHYLILSPSVLSVLWFWSQIPFLEELKGEGVTVSNVERQV